MAGVSADIKGYRELSDADIQLINEIKQVELKVAEKWVEVNNLPSVDGIDKRFLNIAKTHFQEGFSAFVRSVAQPEDPYK